MEVAECGAAALAMVLASWGCHVSLNECRTVCGISRDGVGAHDLVRAADLFGLKAQGFRVDLDGLDSIALPAILHWNFNHYVVLERVRSTDATIVDPAFGRRRVSLEEVSQCFTGIAISFTRTSAFTKRAKDGHDLKPYWPMWRRHIPAMGTIVVASLAIQLLGLIAPLATQLLIDHILVDRQMIWLWGLLFTLVLTSGARVLLLFVRGYMLQSFQQIFDAAVSERFVTHLLRLPLSYYVHRDPGELVQRIESSRAIRDLLSSDSISLVLDTLMLFSYLCLMLLYNLDLTLIIMGLAVVRVLLIGIVRSKVKDAMVAELAAGGRESAALLEAFTGAEAILASDAQPILAQRWSKSATSRFNAGIRRRNLSMTLRSLMLGLQGIATTLVLWTGGRAVIHQRLTLGALGSFLSLQYLFLLPLDTALQSVERLQQVSSHLSRLVDIVSVDQERQGGGAPGDLQGRIDVVGASLASTTAASLILDDITLSILPGMRVSIVGKSGAGKSSLARLLIGLHLPTKGSVSYDGRSLETLDLQLLRKQVGMVLQDTFLFDETIRANIEFGSESLDDKAIHRAIELAGLSAKINSLPERLEFRVGEKGVFLSGGERQRLSLARALARLPSILVLDEATSALDPVSEKEILRNIASLHCTTIHVTHHFAHLPDADLIVVLESGRIVQTGTYAELSACHGPFSDLAAAAEQ